MGVEGLIFGVSGFVGTKPQHSKPDFKYAPYNYNQRKFNPQFLEISRDNFNTALWLSYLEKNKLHFFLQNFDWLKDVIFVFVWDTSQCQLNIYK